MDDRDWLLDILVDLLLFNRDIPLDSSNFVWINRIGTLKFCNTSGVNSVGLNRSIKQRKNKSFVRTVFAEIDNV